ncbi:hypothetical protein MHBO_002154 [Bonamia ostreae]|uniref:Uncharacterized protein n=1 Tax=Bonamia ostreae TaxID=126728 RepID=A0ABV2ALD5_9EUKA
MLEYNGKKFFSDSGEDSSDQKTPKETKPIPNNGKPLQKPIAENNFGEKIVKINREKDDQNIQKSTEKSKFLEPEKKSETAKTNIPLKEVLTEYHKYAKKQLILAKETKDAVSFRELRDLVHSYESGILLLDNEIDLDEPMNVKDFADPFKFDVFIFGLLLFVD